VSERSASLCFQASRSLGTSMREARPDTWMIARLSATRGATAAARPNAPSRPMVLDSTATPRLIRVISETTQSCGK
jgi:hypothetical protein